MPPSLFDPWRARTRPHGQTLRILILEDCMSRMAAFDFFLDRASITHAPSAPAAIEALHRQDWDVVFLDHDLDLSQDHGIPNPGCGVDVISHLAHEHEQVPDFLRLWGRTLFVVHSLNAAWAPHLIGGLRSMGLTANRRAFAWRQSDDLHRLADEGTWDLAREHWDVLSPPFIPVHD